VRLQKLVSHLLVEELEEIVLKLLIFAEIHQKWVETAG
jgi:hypothetical protein